MTTKAEILKAIRNQCIECMGGQVREVALCTSPMCSLFEFRHGTDPHPNENKVQAGKRLAHSDVLDRRIEDN